jgi:hypothetical protein
MKNKLQVLIVPSIGVISAIIGALLGYFLSLQEKRVSLLEEARRQAYVDYLEQREWGIQLAYLNNVRENIEVELAKAEKNRDQKKVEDLRARSSMLQTKIDSLDEQWKTKGKSTLNKIAIYGDSKVIEALLKFFRKAWPSETQCGKNWMLDVSVYQNMRRSLMPKEELVTDIDLAELVLNCVVSEQQKREMSQQIVPPDRVRSR